MIKVKVNKVGSPELIFESIISESENDVYQSSVSGPELFDDFSNLLETNIVYEVLTEDSSGNKIKLNIKKDSSGVIIPLI